jgi:hypothetical protein
MLSPKFWCCLLHMSTVEQNIWLQLINLCGLTLSFANQKFHEPVPQTLFRLSQYTISTKFCMIAQTKMWHNVSIYPREILSHSLGSIKTTAY